MTTRGPREASDGAGGQPRLRSLSVRYVALIVAIVVSSGVILGLVVTLASVRNAAEERRRSLEYAGSVVAASLIPVIADQDPGLINAQLKGILDTSESHSIECIEIRDATGAIIAETEEGCTCDLIVPSRGLLDEFTKPQVVNVPIQVEGQRLASVRIQFLPVGLEDAVYAPMGTTAAVLFLAMVVAALWGAWTVLRTVVEPIETLRDAATSIAHGERGVRLSQDRHDEIGQLASALDDMTDQLSRQERELLESYRSLESAFEDKADLARRLERTMEFKSDFVAVASHELRSPLAVIRLYAEMLVDNEFGGVEPPLKEAIDSIVSATSRLSAIVSSLMDVALLERGLMPLEYENVELCGLIGQAVSDISIIGVRREVRIEFVGTHDRVDLRGDPVRLRQVVDNLLSNAIKYSSIGGVVTVGLDVDEQEVRVSVTDLGSGVPADREEVLFELFGRADASDSASTSGLGLGLPISDRIARAHGGSVTYRPNPGGVGSVFTITLPRRGAQCAEAPDAVSIVSAVGNETGSEY